MHNYVRVGKFRNVNCGYALVQGIVFGSVFEAEEYCTSQGYDVNAWIEADDPKVLAQCQQIARNMLPGLRLLRNNASVLFYDLCAKCTAEAEARDSAKEKREIGWEVHEDWVHEACGKVSGCHECMSIIDAYIMILERISRIPTPKEERK